MRRMNLILYGSSVSQELARNLLENMMEVKRESVGCHSGEVQLIISKPIKETSLIPLLRPSGIHGFRLVSTDD